MPLSRTSLGFAMAAALLSFNAPACFAETPNAPAPQQAATDASAAPAARVAPVEPADRPILEDAEKEKDIRLLIHLTGGEKAVQQVMDQIEATYRQEQPEIPDEFWKKLRQKEDIKGLIDLLVPIYNKYLTEEDIKGLIQFYQSPLGQKLSAIMPSITRDSYVVGKAWGKAKGEEVVREIEAEIEARKQAPSKPAKPSSGKSTGAAGK